MPLIPRFTLGIPHPTRLAVGVTQGKRLSLIPGFTLGITYPTHGQLLRLELLKVMYVSYSRLYSRHYVPNAVTPLAAGDTQGNVCLLFKGALPSSMH